MMKKSITAIALVSACLMTSCGDYNKVLKSQDYSYRYEAAKEYFFSGQYTKASVVLNDMIAILKGSGKAEESLHACHVLLRARRLAGGFFNV